MRMRLVRDELGNPSRLVGTLQDITEMRQEQEIEHERANILRAVASGQALQDTATMVIQSFESRYQRRHAILVTHPDASLPMALVAPSLPGDFARIARPFIEGLVNSASEQAARNAERVIVSDIRTDHRFPQANAVLASLQLQACCATPVIGPDGRVLGVFTVYYHTAQSPDAHELKAIDAGVALLVIASNAALAQPAS